MRGGNVEAEFFGRVIEVAQSEISAMVGLSPSTKGALASRLSRIARLPSMRPLRNAITAGSPGGRAKFFKKR